MKQWPINEMTAWGLAGFRVDPMSGCVIVTVVGEVDMASAVGLDTALRTAAEISPCLVLDMTRLEFMDSTGLGTVLGARRRALQAGGSVSLVCPPRAVRRLLGGTQLQQVFAVYESLAEALSAVAEAARPNDGPSA